MAFSEYMNLEKPISTSFFSFFRLKYGRRRHKDPLRGKPGLFSDWRVDSGTFWSNRPRKGMQNYPRTWWGWSLLLCRIYTPCRSFGSSDCHESKELYGKGNEGKFLKSIYCEKVTKFEEILDIQNYTRPNRWAADDISNVKTKRDISTTWSFLGIIKWLILMILSISAIFM